MKKIFTFGIFLFLLSGIGNNVSATIIKSAGTGVAGLDWSNTTAWAGGVVPTSANIDSVQVVAGDSITINTAVQSCPTLIVNGVLNTNGFALYVNGNAIVKNGGTLSIVKQVYCKNIYNYGKTWAPGKTNSNTTTTVALYVGYTCNGTTPTASTDSCTILNDGIIGWYRTPSTVSTTKGCGLFVYYPNTAKAVNLTHSPGVTSGYVFTPISFLPVSAGTQSQDFNLYINESAAVVGTSSSAPFSLHINDAFPTTYKRTCTIAAGDTLFVAGYFHKNSAPSVAQGQMIYNIYGCLDTGTYRQNKNEFDIYTSATLSSPVTINIGDGTLANAGTLVFGAVINIVPGAANQIIFNPAQYSTIKFNYKAAPAITLTNFSLSAYNLYVNSFGIPATIGALPVAGDLTLAGPISNTVTLNGTAAQAITGGSQTITGLTINNPAGAILASPLTVSGALTLTSGKLTLGTSNLTTGTISGATSSNYIVTNGTGTLTQTAATTGTLYPIGTITGYAPATITPDVAVAVAASVSATTTGTYTGYGINANEWTLTPATATTATLAFTPTAATNTTSPVIFSGVASGIYAAKTAATVSGTTYSATGISLAASATPFATGGTSSSTAVETNTSNSVLVYSANNSLVVKNAKDGDVITVYGLTGSKVVTSVVKGDNTTLALAPGAYIVKVGSTTKKVLVQ
jgi:hypothetical protein